MTEEEKKQQKELWKQDRIRARREEWEKIKSLGGGARLRYFWDYYKIVLVIALGVLLAVWLVINVVVGMRTDTLLYVCVLNSEELDPEVERLQEDYTKARGGLEKMQEIRFDASIDVDPESGGTSQQDVAVAMKIAALVQAGKADVFLAPAEVMEYEQKDGMYLELDSLLTEDEIERLGGDGCLYYAYPPEIYETEYETQHAGETESARDTLHAGNKEKERGEHIYAVRVDQAGVIGNYPIYKEKPVWFSIIGNAPHTEEAMRLLHFLLGEGDTQ